jgi:hypothetical protein
MNTLTDALNDYLKDGKDATNRREVNWGDGCFTMCDYKTSEGYLSFGTHNESLRIYYVQILEQYRRQKRLTRFIQDAQTRFSKIEVAAVGTIKLMVALADLGFNDHGGDFIWAKNGVCCDRPTCNRFLPIKINYRDSDHFKALLPVPAQPPVTLPAANTK